MASITRDQTKCAINWLATALARSNSSRNEHLTVERIVRADILPVNVNHGIGCCRGKRIQSQANDMAGPARLSFNGHSALGIITLVDFSLPARKRERWEVIHAANPVGCRKAAR